ncbi:hypothetical protein PHMEG_0009915 [Phytophthora megakarya]|uniref:FYVE-type domain-containing protein n=1 Tax=Phytophthora megakarya TaxID=4795 RepID=A0A225WFA5_9STRA|nr:hypothetical protein PHMEG_0009915 [Phytophthora megakarya]
MAASPVVSSAIDAPGAALWEADGAQHSIMLPYVRDHADQAVARARTEDPRLHYTALKQVHDVYLYKRMTEPHEALNAAMATSTTSPLGASLSSSFSSLASSRRGVSITNDPELGDFEFRGITRVPGSVDTVLDILASESARENYWVALNTMKDLKAAALLSSARLQSHSSTSSVTSDTDADVTAFPRWSRKYTAAKFSKHNAQVLDCCYAEYATRCTETNSEGHTRRRGFVYRRSVSEHALMSASSISAERLAKAKVQGAARFFIRDWLFDVIESQDPLVCKLVLTCTISVPPTGRGATVSRSDFREFCTELMVGARRALTQQWKDHAAHAGVRSSSSWRRETRCCSVCSAQFSLLRKCYTCRSCGSGVCSKCCLKTAPPVTPSFAPDSSHSGFGSSRVSATRSQQRGSHKRECLLCAQFGPDSGLNAPRAGAATRSRHFSTSMASMARDFAGTARGMQLDLEQEEFDQVHPDLDLRSTASVSGSRRQHSQRSIGSVGSQRSISDDESDEDVRSYTPRLDLLQQLQQRHDRAASEDNVLLAPSIKPRIGTREGPQESSASTEEDEDVYSEDDLANFTLKLL